MKILESRQFRQASLALLLIMPQLIITSVFFIWPTLTALSESFMRSDAFGLHRQFAWFANYVDLFRSSSYLDSVFITLCFSTVVALLALSSGLLVATLVNGTRHGGTYKSMLIWPYAVAPAVAGILWRFLFNPSTGILAYVMQQYGYEWNYLLHSRQAFMLVVIASTWQQFSYNFLFFLAGLQAIPYSLLEAAAIDGAGPFRRFWNIVFPLLSPTSFFLLIINFIYAFFDTFGVIHVITQGGPASATNTMVYKLYHDGFFGLDFGSSAAQSVILMLFVVMLTYFQFNFIEKRVHYS